MKPTDFSLQLSAFLTQYLSAQRNLRPNTLKAYRDAFVLLLRFLRDHKGMAIQRVRLDDLTAELVREFLAYLESERQASARTRNQRLAAIHCFFRWLQSEAPQRLLQCQQVLSIPLKRLRLRRIEYLRTSQLKTILDQPNLQARDGRRDAVLLSLLYDAGARVQELCDLRVRDVRLQSPAVVRLLGKGDKERVVPLMASTAELLGAYLEEWGMKNAPHRTDDPLFCNRRREPLSRSGVSYILAKYVRLARQAGADLPEKITPHVLRHTKAMHMLQSGIPVVLIRDFLGHVDVQTTELYARADLEMKRKALESLPVLVPATGLPPWKKDADLLDWLRAL